MVVRKLIEGFFVQFDEFHLYIVAEQQLTGHRVQSMYTLRMYLSFTLSREKIVAVVPLKIINLSRAIWRNVTHSRNNCMVRKREKEED